MASNEFNKANNKCDSSLLNNQPCKVLIKDTLLTHSIKMPKLENILQLQHSKIKSILKLDPTIPYTKECIKNIEYGVSILMMKLIDRVIEYVLSMKKKTVMVNDIKRVVNENKEFAFLSDVFDESNE